MDINGYYAPSGSTFYVSPVAGELTKTLKSGAGMLHYIEVANTTASARYVFVFDNTAASGNLLMTPTPVPANSKIQVPLPFALGFTTGCTVSSSTTQTAYGAGGANDIQILAVTK